MEIKTIHHYCITVKDLDASLHFYHDLLGMEFSRKVDGGDRVATYLKIPGSGELEFLEFKDGVNVREFDERGTGYAHVAFEVDNPEEYAELFKREGYPFHMELSKLPPFRHYGCMVYDPDGVPVEFVRWLRDDEI